jgi:hypothetical protein
MCVGDGRGKSRIAGGERNLHRLAAAIVEDREIFLVAVQHIVRLHLVCR